MAAFLLLPACELRQAQTIHSGSMQQESGNHMIRLSALRHTPVICCGKRKGLLQSVTFDYDQKKMRSLIVSCGFRGKCVVEAKDILSCSDAFIMAQRCRRFRREDEACGQLFVRDTTGLMAGYIADCAIDERNLSIAALLMRQGYLPSAYRTEIWIYEYKPSEHHRQELIIPASLGSELIFDKEAEEICVFQR